MSRVVGGNVRLSDVDEMPAVRRAIDGVIQNRIGGGELHRSPLSEFLPINPTRGPEFNPALGAAALLGRNDGFLSLRLLTL